MHVKTTLFSMLGALVLAVAPALADETADVPSSAPAGAAPAPAQMTPAEKAAIEAIVRDYLTSNPEVIVDAIEALREKQRQAEAAQQKMALVTHREALLADPATPIVGNPQGDVSVVEFFDYRCGYCKRVFPSLMGTIDSDGGIRLVLKEFPILGPESQYAARAALASRKQGKYSEFHVALMGFRGNLSEAAVMAIARSVGLDTDRLARDMDDDSVTAAIETNMALANALGIRGTPAFIIGDRLVPGALTVETLKSLIAEARGAS